jgi:glycerol kinase
VVLVPAFVGLGAPYWDPYATGLLIGLRRGTKPGHIARAAEESIAFQVADVIEAMDADTKVPFRELRVDGGASVDDLLMQFQADLLGVPVIRPAVSETTALGAAYLAGLAVGYWSSPEEIRKLRAADTRYEPHPGQQKIVAGRARWKRAVERSRNWHEGDE